VFFFPATILSFRVDLQGEIENTRKEKKMLKGGGDKIAKHVPEILEFCINKCLGRRTTK